MKITVVLILLTGLFCNSFSYFITRSQITAAKLPQMQQLDYQINQGSYSTFSVLVQQVITSTLTCQKKIQYLMACQGRIKLNQGVKRQYILKLENDAKLLTGDVSRLNRKIQAYREFMNKLNRTQLSTIYGQKIQELKEAFRLQNAKNAEIKSIQSNSIISYTQILSIQKAIKRILEEKTQQNTQIIIKQNQISALKIRLQKMQVQINTSKDTIAQYDQRLNASYGLEKRLKDLKSEQQIRADEERYQLFNLRLSAKKIARQASSMKQELDDLKTRAAYYKGKIQSVNTQIQKLNGHNFQYQITQINETINGMGSILNDLQKATLKRQFNCSGSSSSRCTTIQTFLPCVSLGRLGMVSYMKYNYKAQTFYSAGSYNIRQLNIFGNEWRVQYGTPYESIIRQQVLTNGYSKFGNSVSCDGIRQLVYGTDRISSISGQSMRLGRGQVFLTPCTKIEAIGRNSLPQIGSMVYFQGFINSHGKFVIVKMAFQ